MPSSASLTPPSPMPTGAVTAIVDEVLAVVLSPARKRDVLREALDLANLDAIPDRPTSLRVFIEGALFATLARQLEVSNALELVAQLRDSLGLALSVVPDDRPTSDVHDRMKLLSSPSRVLVLTQASVVVFLLQDVLGDHVEVLPIGDTATLRDRLRRLAGQPLLLVVDRKHPCAGPDECAMLKRELTPECTVVWWGAHGGEVVNVERHLHGGPRLVPCPFDMQLADLGELCRGLLG